MSNDPIDTDLVERLAEGADVHEPGTERQPEAEPSLVDAPVPGSSTPKSGASIPTGRTRYDPSTLLVEKSDSPPLMAEARRSGGASGQYVHSPAVSAALDTIREAHRRPSWHDIATPKKLSVQWRATLDAIDHAKATARRVPSVIADAEAQRSATLAEATAPEVLPSPGDARAWAERQAIDACRAAAEERRKYDALAEELADEHLDLLAKSIPTMSSDVLARVADLSAAIRDLREGVAAFVKVAGNSGPDVMPARLPRAADLSALDAIEAEVAALVRVTDEPSQPRISPTLGERRRIAAEAAQVPSGLTAELLDLARRERAEDFAHTSLTKGIPTPVLESFARSQAAFLL